MADSLKKIGAIITLDGEKEYKTALQSIKREQSVLRSEMKLSQTAFSGNADSVEALTEKGEILERQCEAQKEKIALLTGALESAKEEYGENSDKVASWQIQLNNAKTDLLKMESAVNDNNTALDEAKVALNKAGDEAEDAGDSVDELAKALDKTEGEADGAESEIRQLASELDNAEEKSGAFAVAAGTLAANAIEFLGGKAKDAAKYVVDVGMKFESSMSNVAALSGASQKDLDRMAKKAKELGSSTKFSASEAADAFGYMALAGWDTSEMLSGIDGVMQLAAASGMDLAAASDMVTDYLSAFGMEAKESAYFADLLAFAQANSNTTAAQLGEAYKNCAANLNAAGQDVETVTSLLEAMANQGLKGSEAGTALNAVMRDITAGMEDGAIAIGDTNVAVTDSQGNFRDLTDILTDVEAATAGMGDAEKAAVLQTTFTADSTKGLNLILNEGVGKCEKYEEALRNSGGAAQATADTMQNNLAGKLTEMNSALEGLGIAAFDYISGPAQGIIEGVTSAISTLTGWITPTSDAWSSFMDEIERTNDEVRKSIKAADETLDKADIDVQSLEAYKTTLLDINDVEHKSEWQKYQLKHVVEQLSDQIPGLAEAYDEETGSINLTNQEIEELIGNQEKLVMQNAAMKARQESMEALAEASLNAARASNAVEEAEEKFHEVAGENINSLNDYIIAWGNSSDAVERAENELRNARDAQNEANEAVVDAQAYLDETNKILDDLGYSEATGKTEEFAEAEKVLADTTEEAGEEVEGLQTRLQAYADSTDQTIEEVAGNLEKLAESYANSYNAAYDSVTGQIGLFDKFPESVAVSAEEILVNMTDQVSNLQAWSENIRILMASTIDDGIVKQLADAGPAAAAQVAELARQVNGGNEEFINRMNELYREKLDIATSFATETAESESHFFAFAEQLGLTAEEISAELSDKGLKAGSNYSDMISQGMNAENGKVESSLNQALEQAVSKEAEYEEIGKQTAVGYAGEMSNELGASVVNISSSLLLISAAAGLFKLTTDALGTSTGEGYAERLQNGISAGIPGVAAQMDRVVAHGNTLGNRLYSSGVYAADGLANGFIGRMNQRYGEVAAAAARIQAVVNSALRIHSPSKLLWESGEFTGEGLTGGTIEAIKAGFPDIKKTALALGDTISSAINPKDMALPEIDMPDMTLRQETRQEESYSAGRQGDPLSQVVGYLQTIAENSRKGIYLDNGVLVGQLGEEMDSNLSDLSDLRRRGM